METHAVRCTWPTTCDHSCPAEKEVCVGSSGHSVRRQLTDSKTRQIQNGTAVTRSEIHCSKMRALTLLSSMTLVLWYADGLGVRGLTVELLSAWPGQWCVSVMTFNLGNGTHEWIKSLLSPSEVRSHSDSVDPEDGPGTRLEGTNTFPIPSKPGLILLGLIHLARVALGSPCSGP